MSAGYFSRAGHVAALVDHLPDRERPAQHAHVQVDAEQDHVPDLAAGQQQVHLFHLPGKGRWRCQTG